METNEHEEVAVHENADLSTNCISDIKLSDNISSSPDMTCDSQTESPTLKNDDDLLENKIAALALNDKLNENENLLNGKVNGDGSDSGVETGASLTMNGVLQRALSSNSGGYASSCGGLEDNIEPVSCNSSMISYCSDVCEKTNSTIVLGIGNDFYASEGGSESSSVTGVPTIRKANGAAKKKVALKEVSSKSPRKSNESTSSTRSRSRPPSVSRSNTLPSKSVAPNLATRDRARSRDKSKDEPSKILMTSSLTRSMSTKRPPKPDSFPTSIKEMSLSTSSPRVNLSRTPSLTRGHRTPLSTPIADDGRWPSISNKSATLQRNARGSSVAPEGLIIRTRIGNIQLDNKSSTFDKYATLPRRRKEKSVEDISKNGSRSSSTTRENLPNRMTISMIKKMPSKDNTNYSSPVKSLPSYPKIAKKPVVPKTKIFHETSVQTAITNKDLEDAFSGHSNSFPRVDAVEMVTIATQSDIRDKEMEKLREKVDKMNADHSQLLTKLSEKSQTVSLLEQDLLREREEKLTVQKELQNNTERVMHMLEGFQAGPTAKEGDSLLMLESQLMISGNVLEKQQEEIVKLQGICRAMQRDMEKSLKIQDNLIKQKNELEEESTELQDFLQMEKVAFQEALKEAENENKQHKTRIAQRESDLERQQEECRALVRICEQRRQEYLGMQTKYNALESRSKELLLSQGSAVSGASVALSGLGNRLELLVDQLITSYNISEQDLEDIVFFNDAYSNSSSGNGSPEFETATSSSGKSPQRGQSFLTAVINAIRNATSSNKPNQEKKESPNIEEGEEEEEDDSTEMLDSETEPCLIMDNVLEDAQMHDSHSQNLMSTSQIMLSQIEVPSEMLKSSMNGDDGSLDNLSQAIANRQQIELQTGAMATRSALRQQQSERNSTSDDISGQESVAEVPSIGDFCTAQSIVDQVIEVDNSVTKLLKVLRLVQLDNDSCIQELVTDKNKIQVSKEEAFEKVTEWEMINQKLKSELKETAQQLIVRSNELTSSKTELHKHRQEIDRLNEDICNLSTLCSAKKTLNDDVDKSIDKSEILNALKALQETGSLPQDEIVSHVVKACSEIPMLKDKLREKERQLAEIANKASNSMTNSWHQAMSEAKRQYEAIDGALETLHSIQNIVKDCPELAKMQRDLEETNFNTINTLPLAPACLSNGNMMSADMNANETMSNENGNSQQQIIDSAA